MSSLKLVIGNKNYSSWSLRAWLAAKHAEVPFEENLIPLFQADSKAKLIQHSASGRAPVLVHNGFVIWDSLAISEYLAELFPERHFWPRDSFARAWARSIVAEMHSGFIPLRKAFRMDLKRVSQPVDAPEEALKDVARIQDIWEQSRQQYGQSGPFLMGEYSLADMFYAPVVTRFVSYGISLSPICLAYIDTMIAHPHMQEWHQEAVKEPWVITW
ncbi:MAG: glutathione S-transferase family protein [Alphaproteobacteria bacterium]|nr:glutathione S-transferase family protein [Alphaproteobacteria bacterium]